MGICLSLFFLFFNLEFFYLFDETFFILLLHLLYKMSQGQKELTDIINYFFPKYFFKEIFHSESNIAYYYSLCMFKCLIAEIRIF